MPSPTTKDLPDHFGKNGSLAPSSAAGLAASRPRLSTLTTRELWRPSTPERLRSGWKNAPETDGWKALQKTLRAVESELQEAANDFGDPLLWGLGEELRSFADWRAATLQLLRGAGRASPKKATNKNTNGKSSNGKPKPSGDTQTLALTAAVEVWCEAAESRATEITFALECLTWAYELPAIAQQTPAEVWWRLAEQLDATAEAAGGQRPGEDAPGTELVIDQLLAGELGLVLTSVLPHARPWRTLGKQSTETLTEGVLAWTDGEGLPPGRGLGYLGLLAGCWTRSRRLCYQTGNRCWDAAAQTQYEWLVRQLVRLVDRDGALPLGAPPVAKGAGLVRAALDCAGDDSDLAAARLRLGEQSIGKSPIKADAPDASVNSEWSGVSLLAADWGRKAPRLLVTYDEADCQLSLSNLGASLLSGVWRTNVTVDGAPVAIDGAWEEQCWFSDDDCDFLEIAVDLEQGGKLERMVLLAKQDGAAMLVDIVHTGRTKTGKGKEVTIEVETRLPLRDDVSFDPAKETREGWLADERRQLAGVMPPAMAEWRVDPRGGEMTAEAGDLVLAHEAVGTAIACPVWFDLKPKRFAKQRTWRQLTVAQSLEPVARDVAVGYRVQAGKDQWLVYRSLAKRANRTVMGQNYSSEGFFGRFNPKTGLAEEYFEVEA